MTGFDACIVVDWSARSKASPAKLSADAIWIAVARKGAAAECHYLRTRAAATEFLQDFLQDELAQGRRSVVGFDFPFAYPKGFAETVTGEADPLILWEWLAARVEDAADNTNNRFDVACALNRMFPGVGPFWGCPTGRADADLPDKGSLRRGHGMPERRAVETLVKTSQPCWKLYTTGSVGSQALLGIPRLQQLRAAFGAQLSVAPFQDPTTPIVVMELFPSLLAKEIEARRNRGEIKDRAQVRVVAECLSRVADSDLNALLRAGDAEEGWILGVGAEDVLRAALPPLISPPPMRNDCFALPAGVDWIPVDEALAHLQDNISVCTPIESIHVDRALHRVLAKDVCALRANPPQANTAVDGYGFAGGRSEGDHILPLVQERAAAGDAGATVPMGQAIRILTGAALPEGVDTVVLQEDVTVQAGHIAFRGPVKQGANTRNAGEDVDTADVILQAGRRLTPADLALAAATGHGALPVRARLRVGVVSTGDELRPAGSHAGPGQIFDANRPMLLSLLTSWGFEAVDLGHVMDDREALRTCLDNGADHVHAILTSGGASSGDEDHVSALLREAGAISLWRIAVKPGRPLALGMWNGTPVFGLPGNPVAALVCSMIFARPALGLMAGEPAKVLQGFDLPANFEKSKKPGRREYLRARVRDGQVEIFKSEGSGRISGLSWAEGLVELPDPAVTIRRGDLVRYIPFTSFQ